MQGSDYNQYMTKTKKTKREPVISVWKGSTQTANDIAQQIAYRFGEDAVKDYDPLKNCFTFQTWIAKGFRVKKGEKALKTITFIPTGEVSKESGKDKMIMRTVCLFYHLQVEPLN